MWSRATGLLALATMNLSAKFKVSNFTHYEDTKGDTKYKYGVVWSSEGHSRSMEIAPFDRAHTSSY